MTRGPIVLDAALRRLFAAGALALVAAHASAAGVPPLAHATAATPVGTAASARGEFAMDRSTEDRILGLDPENISPADVRDILSRASAPRIIALQGSVPLITMQPFAEFLIALGYPEAQLSNPKDGSLSYPSNGSSEELAGAIAWYYESEGLMPMLIGHSQGGMLAMKVLHELAGSFGSEVDVWNPVTEASEHRSWIRDPRSGMIRPVVGLKLPYVAALATGKLPRFLLGQWSMLKKVRQVPDSVEEFSGYTIEWDPIAGTFPGSEAYRATGSAQVRNIMLGVATSHIAMPRVRALALDAVTRAWIDAYRPEENLPLPTGAAVDTSNLLHAADIWFSVKKHWCIELQRSIRARRSGAVAGA
jgi:hypothetical protein